MPYSEVNRDKSRKNDMTVVTVVFTNVRHVPLKELIEAARLQGQTEVKSRWINVL